MRSLDAGSVVTLSLEPTAVPWNLAIDGENVYACLAMRSLSLAMCSACLAMRAPYPATRSVCIATRKIRSAHRSVHRSIDSACGATLSVRRSTRLA